MSHRDVSASPPLVSQRCTTMLGISPWFLGANSGPHTWHGKLSSDWAMSLVKSVVSEYAIKNYTLYIVFFNIPLAYIDYSKQRVSLWYFHSYIWICLNHTLFNPSHLLFPWLLPSLQNGLTNSWRIFFLLILNECSQI